jgi:SAM-dependent methyltransferase
MSTVKVKLRENTEVVPPAPPEDLLWELGEHPLVLDLFCGVGGVARTLTTYGHRGPGWDVLGIDADASKVDTFPDYFVEWDLEDGLPPIVDELADRDLIDIVWASPPCQFATGVQYARSGENLIPLARDLLAEIDAPVKIIENVPDAKPHLENPIQFCGGAFGLGVQKHRVFETNFFAMSTPCDHPNGGFEFCIGDRETPVEAYREAHGFPADAGLGTKQLREAIPPAYVEELLKQYQQYAPHG